MHFRWWNVEPSQVQGVDDARAFLDSNQHIDFESDVPQHASTRRIIPDSERGDDTVLLLGHQM